MASAARNPWYRDGRSVDGNLAYDLDWAVRERELRHAGELPRRREAEREQARPKVREKVRVREKQQISPFTVLGTMAVIGMALMILMGYIQLTMISTETVELQSQLSTLQTENIRLTTAYDQMFDLTTVKEAAEAAGMVKPGRSQVCYIDLSEGDSTVVYRQEEPNVLTKVLTSLNHGVYAVVEYFD